MDGEIALDDLILQLLDLDFVHLLDLAVSFQVSLLEMFELPLQLLELPSDTFIFLRVDLIGHLELLIKVHIICRQLTQPVVEVLILPLLFIMEMCVLLLLLLQDLQVVIQLLRVELVERLHVLETFLQVLDLGLHGDLQLRITLSTIYTQLLDLTCELLLPLITLLDEPLLHIGMLIKQTLDLTLILRQQLRSLINEMRLDVIQLSHDPLPQLEELHPHLLDQMLHIHRLVLDHLAIIIILFVQFVQEHLNEMILTFHDPGEHRLLVLDHLIELLTLFILLEFCPFLLESSILLVGTDTLNLNLFISFLAPTILFLSGILLLLLILELDDTQLLITLPDLEVYDSPRILDLLLPLMSLLIVHNKLYIFIYIYNSI